MRIIANFRLKIEDKLKKDFHLICIHQDITMHEVIRNLIKSYVKENKQLLFKKSH